MIRPWMIYTNLTWELASREHPRVVIMGMLLPGAMFPWLTLFFKKFEKFAAAVALNFAYHFMKTHRAIRMTPAQAAGVEQSSMAGCRTG
jgi:hypothetical protein